MAKFFGLLGNDEDEYYRSSDYQSDFGDTSFQEYGGYTPYESDLLKQAEGGLSSLMSEGLTPVEEAILAKQRTAGLSEIREGAYGMPIGAQRVAELGNIADTGLRGLQMSQTRRQNAINSAMPYVSFRGGENRAKYDYGYNQSYRKNLYNQNERQYMGELNRKAKESSAESGLDLSDLLDTGISAVTNWGLNSLTGGGKASTGVSARNPSGYKAGAEKGNQGGRLW